MRPRPIERDPRLLNANIVYSDSLWSTGNGPAAIEHMQAYLDENPRTAHGNRALSVYLISEGFVAKGLEALERAVSILPEEPFFLFELGRNLIAHDVAARKIPSKDKIEKALPLLLKACKNTNFDNVRYLSVYCTALVLNNEANKALYLLQELMDRGGYSEDRKSELMLEMMTVEGFESVISKIRKEAALADDVEEEEEKE